MNTIAALIMGAAAAALVTALLGLAIIPWLRKLHFGQTILEIGPKWAQRKRQGTPTDGRTHVYLRHNSRSRGDCYYR